MANRYPENMPILYRNILDSLPDGIAQDAFLWAVERPGEDHMCYRAERFAREVDQIANILRPMLDSAAKNHGLQAADLDLERFILTRHANWRFCGNLKPAFLEVNYG